MSGDSGAARPLVDEVKRLRAQVKAVRDLAELDSGDVFLKPGTRIKRVTERCDGYTVTTSMVTVKDLAAALATGVDQ